jgi:hypothetical protein
MSAGGQCYFRYDEIPGPFQFLQIAASGWDDQRQLLFIDYLGKRTAFCANNWARSDYDSTTTSAAD